MFLPYVAIGLLVGAFLGIFGMCMCVMASRNSVADAVVDARIKSLKKKAKAA